ncbi:putative metalloprotease CJM1_0395 family protein [Maricaulis sp. W15]|uniref:putative metalloprotease CJM1_0395 family protein n=1 Tax=Maricaulis sp. W15 TaxID=1772333 RepID=UPI0018E9ADAD|nr:putative metalloprotease CJM1_0395 family protein [Maricaulis sp. W15]
MIASSVSSVVSTPAIARAARTIATEQTNRLTACGSCGSAACGGCSGGAKATAPDALSDNEHKQVDALKARDREVRAHERAHQAVGGQYAGAASYTFQKGPDGRAYAVGGEVPIDASEIRGAPQATIDKMQQVKAAALAPVEPSGQDRKVAALADSKIAQARAELSRQRGEAGGEGETAAPGEKLQPSLNQQIAEMRQADTQSATSSASTAPTDLTAYAANAYRHQASAVFRGQVCASDLAVPIGMAVQPGKAPNHPAQPVAAP